MHKNENCDMTALINTFKYIPNITLFHINSQNTVNEVYYYMYAYTIFVFVHIEIHFYNKINVLSPNWCGSVNWALPYKEKGTVRFPVRAHAWVASHVPSRGGGVRGNYTLLSHSPSFSIPSPLYRNK